MNRLKLLPFFWTFLTISACQTDRFTDSLYQVNSFSLFAEGQYDGFYSYQDILKLGDFGIGTFDRLNGEMVLLDGKIFRFEADGTAVEMGTAETAPVATFCSFDVDLTFEFENINLEELKSEIDKKLPNLDYFYAIRIEGEYDSLLTRSVYAQETPYQVLSEVIKGEVRRESLQVTGTGLGFRAPDYLDKALWKDYHLHFIAEDHSFGGHIHSAKLAAVTVKIDVMTDLKLILNDK